jgi:sugar diacid utilization regulator
MAATGAAVAARHGSSEGRVRFPQPAVARSADQENGVVERLAEVHAAMLDAVLDRGGLDQVAELAAAAAGASVAVVIPRRALSIAPIDHAPPDEQAALQRWVADRVRGRPSAVPPDVIAEAPIRLREEIVGVVALLRSDPPARPEASELLRLAASAALTQLAIEDAKEETEHSLRGAFLEELRSRDDLAGAEIVRRAARLGCDLAGGAVILCSELTVERPRLVAATIAAEHPGALAQQLDGTQPGSPPRVYAALPAVGGEDAAKSTVELATRLCARLERYGKVAISSFRPDPGDLACAVREAELVLEVMQHSGASITDEVRGGTYKLLFRVLASHPDEIYEFYESTIAAMVRYDDLNRTELVNTLRTYLSTNCNMNATASAIFAHRHTIAYRLERIHELTGLDPTNCEDCERLGLGLKVHRLLAPRLPR